MELSNCTIIQESVILIACHDIRRFLKIDSQERKFFPQRAERCCVFYAALPSG